MQSPLVCSWGVLPLSGLGIYLRFHVEQGDPGMEPKTQTVSIPGEGRHLGFPPDQTPTCTVIDSLGETLATQREGRDPGPTLVRKSGPSRKEHRLSHKPGDPQVHFFTT
jgi:hypothetical protein